MRKEKNEKTIKMVITAVVIILLVWFIIVSPLLKFKSMEKTMLEASERYFEINSSKLPLGNKLRRISLQTLYDQDFITEDLRAPYTNKYCDTDNSWVRVTKVDNEYQYSAYLECGMFKSKTDHSGPEIKLNGDEEVTIYQGEKYKDAGVKSVIDDTDGKMKKSQVTVDTSKVNTDVVGTYEVTYKAIDSLENKTEKVRKVKVIQTLNNIVNKNTDKSKTYKGYQENNYVMLDGIVFKMVGVNEDKTVKIVTDEPISIVDYTSVDTWLNDYFYEKLSDSAKKYVSEDSKWCLDIVKKNTKTTKCSKKSKKKAVGLLSVSDFNNSQDKNGEYNLNISTWTSQKKDSKNNWYISSNEIVSKENTENLSVAPVLNIIEDATVISGNGTKENPYRLKGNTKKLKDGEKISNAKVGEYISYSGYSWRVIGKEEDETTKIVMVDVLDDESTSYKTNYIEEDATGGFNPEQKGNIGYKIRNDISSYIKTDLFTNKKQSANIYKGTVKYTGEKVNKNYNLKLSLISMYDLFSNYTSDISTMGYWYIDYSQKDKEYYQMIGDSGIKHSQSNLIGDINIRLVGYLNKNVVVSKGNGTFENNYQITK